MHDQTASTQSGQFIVNVKSALGPISFIAPLPTSPVDVQTIQPTLGDTSIVSQLVTIVVPPHDVGGTREKWGHIKKNLCHPPLANCFRRHCYGATGR